MKIKELLEQTYAPVPPGQGSKLPPTTPTEGPPATANTPQTPAAPGTTPPVTPPNPNTPQVGQPMGQQQTPTTGTPTGQSAVQQQTQQGMKDTMTDLDKIAAQIVGLKQKQQQMQQQIQTPAV